MRTSALVGGRPADTAFWQTPALSVYCDGSNYVAIEATDAYGVLPSGVTSDPKTTIASVFAGSLAIPEKFMGIHVHNYINTSPTTPEPSIPIGCLRTHDVRMAWPDIETSAGVYTWTLFDQFVDWAESIGAEVCHTLAFTPSFYASDLSKFDQYGRAGASSMPTPVSAWTNYVTAVAQRYAGRIKYYEVWNEPNYQSSATVGTWFGTVANMVTLASAAYTAIKAADPNAIVYSPACTGETAGAFGTSAPTFYTNYFAAGGGAHCDQIAIHFYLSFNRAPSYLPTYFDTFRSIADAAGLSAKPIVCSEIGNQEIYSSNGQVPMGDDERGRFLARCMIYLALKGAQRCYWYDYDGGNYGSLVNGVYRRHGMIDPTSKAETSQCDEWRRLAELLPGATLQNVNVLNSGQLAITTSRGQGIF